MHLAPMMIKQEGHVAGPERGQRLMAAGGLLGALAAASCCILPLALFGLGVSGAWIGTFTQLAPYQPFLIAATLGCLVTAIGSFTAHQRSRAPRVKHARGRYRIGSCGLGS
jgi:mercuric ion transport protein